jgi:hypothetical protein
MSTLDFRRTLWFYSEKGKELKIHRKTAVYGGACLSSRLSQLWEAEIGTIMVLDQLWGVGGSL